MKKIILLLALALFIALTGCKVEDKAPVTIRIASNPSDTLVYADGSYKGRTPLDIDGVTKGEHRIVIEKTGYIAGKSNIKVEKDALFNFNLEKVPIIFDEECENIHYAIVDGNKLYATDAYWGPARTYIRCIDLNKKQEIWKYEISKACINDTKDFKLMDGKVYISIYNVYEGVYFVYVIDEKGNLLNKSTLDWPTQGEISKEDIIVNYDFDFFNKTYDNLIDGYSTKEHRYIWRKHIKGNPVIGKDLGGSNYYLFQVVNSYLRIIKIDKRTGKFIADHTFPEMGDFPAGEYSGNFLVEPFAIIEHKAFFTPDEGHIYCVDLDSMDIVNKFDTGIYFSENKVKVENGLFFIPGEGKTLIIDSNSGKIIKTLDKGFDKIAVNDERTYIAVNGDKIYCFNRSGRETPFPYSPNMLGGSFTNMQIKNNILIATAVNRITGEAIDCIYVFDTKTSEPLFTLKNADMISFTGSMLIATTFEDSFSKKNSKLIIIDLSKLQK